MQVQLSCVIASSFVKFSPHIIKFGFWLLSTCNWCIYFDRYSAHLLAADALSYFALIL